MGVKTKQKETATETPSLHGRALENLEFIRDTMERATSFTAVPGYGGMLMGATAIGAAIVASASNGLEWVATWLVEALLAFLIGIFAMWQKAKSLEESLRNKPAKKFAMGFAPPLIMGVVLTGMLAINGLFRFMPAVWLGLYGTAVITGGAFSVRTVPIMGWCFVVLSAIAAVLPGYGNLLMGIGFGGLHMVFGLIIGRKYGG